MINCNIIITRYPSVHIIISHIIIIAESCETKFQKLCTYMSFIIHVIETPYFIELEWNTFFTDNTCFYGLEPIILRSNNLFDWTVFFISMEHSWIWIVTFIFLFLPISHEASDADLIQKSISNSAFNYDFFQQWLEIRRRQYPMESQSDEVEC